MGAAERVGDRLPGRPEEHPLGTEPHHEESRAAIRLIAVVTLVALVTVAVLSLWLAPERALVRRGELTEPHKALAQVEAFDRSQLGDTPVTFVVGSSVARQAFDAEALQEALAPRWKVEKIAFNRGAPVFAAGLVQQLDVRPGDRVVLQLSEDHFMEDWLATKEADGLVQLLLPADRIWALPLPVPARLEALAARPRRFHAWRLAAGEGLMAWLRVPMGGQVPAAKDLSIKVRKLQSRSGYTPPRRGEPLDQRWVFDEGPEQINRAAVRHLADWLHARGAELWGVRVPFRPEMYGTRIGHDTRARFEALTPGEVDHWVDLPQLPGSSYSDHRHPNLDGQPVLTAALAEALKASP